MTISTKVPDSIVQGENLEFQLDLQDYSGWDEVKFAITGPEKYEIIGVETDGTFLFEATPATTAAWECGNFKYSITATKSTTHYKFVTDGRFQVIEDISQMSNLDTRPWACKVLESIRNLITGDVANNVQSYSVDGRSLSKYTREELLTLYGRFQSECEKAQNVQDGKTTRTKLQFRFRDGGMGY